MLASVQVQMKMKVQMREPKGQKREPKGQKREPKGEKLFRVPP
jgi:hypothetical protein